MKFSSQCIQQVLRLIGSGCCHDSTSSLCQPSPLSLPLARLRPSSLLLLTHLTLSLSGSPPTPFSLSPSLCWNARPGIILSLSPSFAAAERTVKLHAFILFFPARPGTPIKVRQVKTRCVLYELGSAVSVSGEKCWGVRVEGGWTSALVGCAVCALERHRAATLRLSVQC